MSSVYNLQNKTWGGGGVSVLWIIVWEEDSKGEHEIFAKFG